MIDQGPWYGACMHGIELNLTEWNVIEALSNATLGLKELAPKAGYEVSGYLRRTVASLVKRWILGDKKPGYFVQLEYLWMIEG